MMLDDFLLPDTPQQIAEQYKTLKVFAQDQDFGLLEDNFIVLDTETTGLSFKTCELIEIAAARIEQRKIVDRFSTFVNPTKLIPEEITKLTHITNADVFNAPSSRQAVKQLTDFVGGMPILAHNAHFDRTFIERVKGGCFVSDTWIDTLALSRIALPCLSSHKLADLSAMFGHDRVSHRAMDDVEALAELWPIVLAGLRLLGPDLMRFLADMHEGYDWPFRPIFSYLARDKVDAGFDVLQRRHQIVQPDRWVPQAGAQAAAQASPTLFPVLKEQIDAVFKPQGSMAGIYEKYEFRPEQLRMAQEVQEVQQHGGVSCIEAGTGVGKSMAYLVPSALFSINNQTGVGIATKTNILTDQLMHKELPVLAKLFAEKTVDVAGSMPACHTPAGSSPAGAPVGSKGASTSTSSRVAPSRTSAGAAATPHFSYCALKGFDHYPCLQKIMQAATQPIFSPEEDNDQVGSQEGQKQESSVAVQDCLTALAVSLAYACQCPTGDIDRLGIRWSNVPRSLITSTAEGCLRAQCPFYPHECLVFAARKKAATSNIVVTNHALLLCGVDADGTVLPPLEHWIIDEAHSFESEARKLWAREISSATVRATFEHIGGVRTGALHALLVQAASCEGSTLIAGLLTKAASLCARASLRCNDLFSEIAGFCQEQAPSRGFYANQSYDTSEIWISDELRATPAWEKIQVTATCTMQALEEAVKNITEAQQKIAEQITKPDAFLTSDIRSLRDLLASLSLIMKEQSSEYVYSIQVRRTAGNSRHYALRAEKLDIGEQLANKWLPQNKSCVFTSATLTANGDFKHFNHAVGIDRLDSRGQLDQSYQPDQPDQPDQLNQLEEVPVKHACIPSSFDYEHNMRVLVARDLPLAQSPEYIEKLADMLYSVHCAMKGSVLSLFTNRRDMEATYKFLQPRLAQAGLSLAMQQKTTSAQQLQRKFIAEKTLSLFALKSFWEGVDAAGDTLRCVVIVKLPFSSPNDPLSKQRAAQDDRTWWKYSLPEAIISVKQAAGRLIRSSSDKGVLIFADSRLLTKRYGSQFLSSLPQKEYVALEAQYIGRYIELLHMW